MIDLINISKTYRLKGIAKQIFSDLTLSFPQDRNIAILGPNGSGKSTLLRLIAGSEQPDSGEIIRHGRLSWPLGFSGGFNGSMTGLENIRFVARIYGEDLRRVTNDVEAFCELGASLHLPVRGYSTGMRARLALGLSLAFDFDTYLIDEIIGVGDAAFRQKSLDTFRRKIPEAQLIMASHSMNHVREFCHCGLLLAPTGIAFYQDIESLVAAYENLARP